MTTYLLLSPITGLAQSAQELFARGAVSHERGQLAAAERDYKAAVAADSSYRDAHHNLGVLYVQEQRWLEAEAAYRKAIALDPNAWHTLENLSDMLVQLNRADEAVTLAHRLVENADGESARTRLARVLIAAGDTAEGCRELLRALNFNTANSGLQLELAACHAENGDLDGAVLHATAVIGRDPKNPAALALLEDVRVQQRAITWSWAPVLVFIAAVCAAVGARRPEQWGQRRVAVGVIAISVATFVWLFAGSLFWLTGGTWGLFQFYAAYRFRCAHASRVGERAEYLRAAGTVLGCVALADGELQPAELRLIRETYEKAGFTDQDLAIIGQTLRQCVSDFQSQLFEHRALHETLRGASIAFARISNETSRLELFRTAVRVALSDQHASAGELDAVRACGTWLDIPEVEQNHIWHEVGSTKIDTVAPAS